MNVVLKMQSRSVGLGRKGKNSRLILVAEEEEEQSAVLAGIKCEGECPVDPGGRCTSLLNG